MKDTETQKIAPENENATVQVEEEKKEEEVNEDPETELIEDLAKTMVGNLANEEEMKMITTDGDQEPFDGYTNIINFDPDSDSFIFDLPLAR